MYIRGRSSVIFKCQYVSEKHLTLIQFWPTKKSNKRFKGCYCTTNKPSNFQSLKWEITNTLMSDTTWKPNLCWCFTAWQVRCAYVGKTWTIVKVIYWSWVFLKWFGWYLGWGNWPGEPETPFNVLASFGFFCTKYTEKQL